ncbi:MAG: HAD-IA family hydrolase [Chloroflexi bacterium]|mgnify:CR=1 FL=1|jgi:HAD superfamily hydrolase (TIGR01509 family)|nr:HAD-IA family hydrolase [Chloroflexota bacterium]
MSKALIFDCDGVLGDTERDGHLVAFNRMWRENGVDWQWTLEQYAEKLKIGGGKERMFSLGQDDDFRAVYDVPASEEEWWATVAGWHKRKSELYKELITTGAIPARPGVKRLAEAALAAGWTLVVCSTSALSSVQAVLNHVMGDETAARFAGVFAGDMVKAKKPAPDVYNLAVERLALDPADCVVVEDSRNGLLAAVAAGMSCIVTFNQLTQGEDFSEAAIVLSSLGDPGGEQAVVVQNRTSASPQGYFSLDDLEKVLESRQA